MMAAQDLHIQNHLRPANKDSCCKNQPKLSRTASGRLTCMLNVIVRVSSSLGFVVITGRSFSRMIPVFVRTGKMGGNMFGVAQVKKSSVIVA